MKRVIISCLTMLLTVCASAEDPQQKFSPEKFQADLEQFITKEACLTPQEATKFFPLYREMLKKQREVFNQMKALGQIKPTEESECKKAIKKRDDLELEQKSIQQIYHNKFFGVLPASKVYEVLNAEDRFHRRMFRNWGQGGGHQSHKKEHRK